MALPVAKPFDPVASASRLHQVPQRRVSPVFLKISARLPQRPAAADPGFSSSISDLGKEPVWFPAGYRGLFERIREQARNQALPRNSAEAASSVGKRRLRQVLPFPGPMWQPRRSLPRAFAVHRVHGTSASARDSARLARTSRWARRRRARVCSRQRQQLDPASRKGRKCARRRNSAAVLADNASPPGSNSRGGNASTSADKWPARHSHYAANQTATVPPRFFLPGFAAVFPAPNRP